VVELFAPVRERYAELVADQAHLEDLLADGAARAREVATATMSAVRDRVGLLR
jgi:tryptophanyl-tRNA synthetase